MSGAAMTADNPLWSIRVPVPAAAVEAIARVEAALEPFAIALSSFEVEGGPAWVVEALSSGQPDSRAVRRALAEAGVDGEAAVTIEPVADRDWIAECQRNMPPLRAGRFFVHGAHIPAAAAPRGTLALEIDPGLAFGTGHHESTRGCLLAIDRLARRRRFVRPLDMGCGSGILALAMARLWGVPVLACDNDPQAVAVARENARLNGLDALVRVVKSQGYAAAAVRRRAPFDLVVANILARPLCRMAGALSRHLAADGLAVLSGLLANQEEMVLAAHRPHGLDLVERRRLGDWSVIVIGRERPRGRSRSAMGA